MAPLDLPREEVPTSSLPRISIRCEGIWLIRQMQLKCVGEEATGDMPMPDTQPQPTVDTSSQVPTEIEVPSQEQLEVIEFMRKGFEDMRMMMSEGFTRLLERIDGLDTHMTSQDVDIRSLRDEFRNFKGEDVAIDLPEQQGDAPAQD
ncbi:hypothetical protein PIB30_067123 [Stylosanthes scabra]|uniref:Uncharacterized protein n=1 Tax=Stylosanthes scabra TaxID=79078 RepID=A0ABU6TPP4_9FABA|nr:hypothetical protein [Stylosanthes scabra]